MGGAGNEARNDEPAGPGGGLGLCPVLGGGPAGGGRPGLPGGPAAAGDAAPLDQVTEFYVTPSHEDMVRFTVEENGLVQALGELRVAWRGPYQAIRYERGQHTYHIDLFRTYEPLGDVVLYENGFLCFEGSLFRVEEGAAYQRCLELCREALP